MGRLGGGTRPTQALPQIRKGIWFTRSLIKKCFLHPAQLGTHLSSAHPRHPSSPVLISVWCKAKSVMKRVFYWSWIVHHYTFWSLLISRFLCVLSSGSDATPRAYLTSMYASVFITYSCLIMLTPGMFPLQMCRGSKSRTDDSTCHVSTKFQQYVYLGVLKTSFSNLKNTPQCLPRDDHSCLNFPSPPRE